MKRYEHIQVSDATYMPGCASGSHPRLRQLTQQIGRYGNVTCRPRAFGFFSGFQSKLTWVTHSMAVSNAACKHVMLDLNNIRCYSNEGDCLDDFDASWNEVDCFFLTHPEGRNAHFFFFPFWEIANVDTDLKQQGLVRATAPKILSEIRIDEVVIYFQLWFRLLL